MQKKLIALAIAGLVSAPAFAQSNVTVYGSIDYGVTHYNKNVRTNDDGSKIKNRTAVDSGVSKANRIGFKGVEDLGNGLKAVFVYESGFEGDIDDGGFGGNTTREAKVALAGGFGTVAFGRQYTPQHLFLSAIDPFGQNGLGAVGNIVNHTKRLNNLAAYITPDFGGFNVVLGYTANGLDDEGPGNRFNTVGEKDIRVFAVAPNYSGNGLFVGANYHQAKGDKKVFENAGLYAAYDFGGSPFRLGAFYDQTKYGDLAAIATYDGVKDRSAGVTAQFAITDADKLQFSGIARKLDSELTSTGDKETGYQFAVGYEHALSKRTALYAQVAFQDKDAASAVNPLDFAGIGSAGLGGGNNNRYADPTSGDDYSNTGSYRRAYTVGIRHDF